MTSIPDNLQHVIRADMPLAPHVWLGIGGPAHFLAEPVDQEQLVQIVAWTAQEGMSVKILGGGSNLLVRESGFDGVVISLSAAATSGMTISESTLSAGAGAKLSHAVIKAVGSGLGGLEHLVGIPGTVGGAVVGNVSAGGRDIGSVVRSVSVLQSDGSIEKIDQSEAGFSHRNSGLVGMNVIQVDFGLEFQDLESVTKRMQKLWISRNAARPAEQKRIAVPFVDPDGMSVRDLIQSVGLAGIREGAAALDSAQPQYLIANDGASSDDCLRLIERVREQVLLQTGIDLPLNLQIW